MSKKKNQVWEAINDITFKKDGSSLTLPSSDYVQFVINRALSYFPDTLMQANVLNKLTARGIPRELHYAYAVNSVEPRRRFATWAKKKAADRDDIVSFISQEKSLSFRRARELVLCLSEERVAEVRKHMAELEALKGGQTSS